MSLKSKLHYKNLLNPFGILRTKEILKINPTLIPERLDSQNTTSTIYEFDEVTYKELNNVSHKNYDSILKSNFIKWINIEGINKREIEIICNLFNIHYLISEDILSIAQRPKFEEFDNHIFCLLNMLFFNEEKSTIETEQISIVLGKNYVISFQEDAHRDVFDSLREKLKVQQTKIRQSNVDYLCYVLIDTIVDHYFLVMEKLGDKIEQLEEEVIKSPNTKSLSTINQTRKELIVLKRNIAPVRELANSFVKSDSKLINEKTIKYYRDVYDHIVQANDLVENYRDMMVTIQDLYINQVNLKMNEVMKVMTIVTCLLAPATVIGGIFGMNFDKLPYIHNQNGFYIAVGLMLLIPLWMIWIFKRRGWF